MKKICLYPIAIPIGNNDDITLRAINILQNVDVVIGEERNTTEIFLKRNRVTNKEIIVLNEHNEKNEAISILHYLINNDSQAALISENGTPCIADPGASLVNLFHEYGLPVVPIPGASSIMAALMSAGIVQNCFQFTGFLSPKTEIRRQEIKNFLKITIPIIILETPYRRKVLLHDLQTICGAQKKIVFAYKLTMPDELIIKSTVEDVIKRTNDLQKGEFVIILL